MSTSFCFLNNNNITYIDLHNNHKKELPLEFLGNIWSPMRNLPFSGAVDCLFKEKWAEAHHLYHLAGLVQQLHPHIPWQWELQFSIIELIWVWEIYQDEYLNQRDINVKGKSYFQDNVDDPDDLAQMRNFIREREPDEIIDERIQQRLKHWVYKKDTIPSEIGSQ